MRTELILNEDVRTNTTRVGASAMNKAMLETRKKMMDERSKDPEYLKTSYERQNKIKKETYVDDRKRVA